MAPAGRPGTVTVRYWPPDSGPGSPSSHWLTETPAPACRVSQIRVGVTGVYGSGGAGAAVRTLPVPSTATQDTEEPHEIPVSSPAASMVPGPSQVVPVQLTRAPRPSTAKQDEAETHATDCRVLGSMPSVAFQEPPFQVAPLPPSSTTEQNVVRARHRGRCRKARDHVPVVLGPRGSVPHEGPAVLDGDTEGHGRAGHRFGGSRRQPHPTTWIPAA